MGVRPATFRGGPLRRVAEWGRIGVTLDKTQARTTSSPGSYGRDEGETSF
jgi:hypothetical protein